MPDLLTRDQKLMMGLLEACYSNYPELVERWFNEKHLKPICKSQHYNYDDRATYYCQLFFGHEGPHEYRTVLKW